MTKILCWNIAGIRASIKKGALDFLSDGEYDIICFQETKAEEEQVKISEALSAMYPYRYWRSTQGITQRKGLSGTAIWSKKEAVNNIEPPAIDSEGRVTTLEFPEWNLVTVYTPNSQGPHSERHIYRVGVWDEHFRNYINNLNANKPTIVCGDFNVGKDDIDVYKPDEWRNTCAGFLDAERDNFNELLEDGWVDTYRIFYPNQPDKYTFWDQKLPYLRKTNRGWRIDYFLVPSNFKKNVKKADIHPGIMGSDHCPISLEIKQKKLRTFKVINK